MARKNLTKASIEAFAYESAGPSRQVLWDGKVLGFGCRVTPADGKQYVLSYRFNGRARLMSLGRTDHFPSLDQAREKAQTLLFELRHKGIDPLSSRQRLSNAETLGELWRTYKSEHIDRMAEHTRKVVGSMWSCHIEEQLAHLKPTQIQGSDLIRLHDRVTRDAGPVVANRCIQRLRGMLNWAQARDEHLFPLGWKNPAEKVTLHRELPRTHLLDAEQMRKLAEALQDDPSPWVRVFCTLLMLVGCRMGELRRLKWADVNFERRTGFIGQTKNGSDLLLHFPPIAVELLKSLPVMAGTEYVFPGRPITQPMIEPRRAYKRALKRAGLPVKTTFHDLRRSYGTALARAGASAELVARALNNSSNVAARVYVQLAANDVRKLSEANALAILPGGSPA